MPMDEAKLEAKKRLATSLQMQLNSMAEADGATDDDPNYVLLSDKLNRVSRSLEEHYAATRPTDANGKLTADAQSTLPISTPRPSNEELISTDNYFFEPSVAEVRHRIENDPELVNRLGLQDWLRQSTPARPNVNIGPMDPTTGIGTAIGVQQSENMLDTLKADPTPGSTYARVADEMWKEALARAQQNGVEMKRYSKVKLGETPLDWLAGGVTKLANDVVAPAASAAGDVLTLGTGRLTGKHTKGALEWAGMEHDVADPEAIERRNPNLANAARVAAYMLPQQPTNLAVNEGLKRAGNLVTRRYGEEAAKSATSRYLTSAVVGAGAAAGEQVIGDTAHDVAAGRGVGESFGDAVSNAPASAVWGGLLSAPGQFVADAASGWRGTVRESDKQLKALRDAGGETSVFGDRGSGYVAPNDIRQAVTKAAGHRELGTAADIYANKLAPQIQESLDDQLRNERIRTERETNEYFTHPAYQDTVSSQEAVNALVDMARTGWAEGGVSGNRVHVDKKKLAAVGEALMDGVAEPRSFNSKARAEKLAQQTGGTVVDGTVASYLFPSLKIAPTHHVVIVGNKMNAQTLTELERRIDEALDISRNRRGKSNQDPVYTPFNAAIKKIRDTFQAFEDEAGNLVAPPGWAAPSQPAPRPSQARRARAAKPKDQPLIPADEGLPPETTASAQQGAAAAKPQRRDFGDINDYLAAMDQWHAQQGSGGEDPFPLEHQRVEPLSGETTPRRGPPETIGSADVRMEPETIGSGEVQMEPETVSSRNARAMPPSTEGGPPPFTEKIPSTKRSIAPDEAYSTLKGNKLTLEPHDGLTEPAPYPDESVPAPDWREWRSADNEGNDWYEAIVQPGRPARSGEAKRLQDLAEQRQIMEHEQRALAEAEAAPTPRQPFPEPATVDEAMERLRAFFERVNERLGPISPDDVTEMLRSNLAKFNLSEDQLKELAKTVGPFAAGVAIDKFTDDEDGFGAVAGAAVGGIRGKGGRKGSSGGTTNAPNANPNVRPMKAKLADGTEVSGFSAMRHRQHERLKRLGDAGAQLNKDSPKGARHKILNFNQHSGSPEDAILLEEARKLGLEDELFRAAGVQNYERLRERGWGGATLEGQGGLWNRLANFARPRADAVGRAVSGDPINPDLAPELRNRFGEGMRELLNMSGGRPGRFADDTQFIRDYLWSLIDGKSAPRQEEQQ